LPESPIALRAPRWPQNYDECARAVKPVAP